MAGALRSLLKQWFATGKKPTGAQFGQLIDTFFSPAEDMLPISNVQGLATALGDKADQQAVDNLSTEVANLQASGGGVFSMGFTVNIPNNPLGINGTVVKQGDRIDAFLANNFHKATPPTYMQPSLAETITPTDGVYYEICRQIAVAIALNFNQNDAGAAQGYTISKNGAVVANAANWTENLAPAAAQNFVYQGSVTFAIGPVKNDSDGNPYPTGQIQAGTINSNSHTLQFILPWLYGVNDNNSGFDVYATGTKVVQPAGGNLSINFNTSTAKFLWFAHDAALATKTKWQVSALNSGNIGGASDLFPAPVTVSVTAAADPANNFAGWTANLKLYVTGFKTTNTSPMTIS